MAISLLSGSDCGALSLYTFLGILGGSCEKGIGKGDDFSFGAYASYILWVKCLGFKSDKDIATTHEV